MHDSQLHISRELTAGQALFSSIRWPAIPALQWRVMLQSFLASILFGLSFLLSLMMSPLRREFLRVG
ncbi:hypothetical protein VTN77DRAFT_2024 [Rasamsonia byssochlamydoides]|uniref:uncharacterized protein n=1 Tax=Rasamsonia byssochlamydoides TaxID=89139 RepID=UPI00374346D9